MSFLGKITLFLESPLGDNGNFRELTSYRGCPLIGLFVSLSLTNIHNESCEMGPIPFLTIPNALIRTLPPYFLIVIADNGEPLNKVVF